MCQWLAQPALRIFLDCLPNWQVFTMSKGNTKAQEMTSAISTESILIIGESNWIQTTTVIWFVWLIWFVLFIWLIWFIWLVSFNQKPDKPDRPERPDEPDP